MWDILWLILAFWAGVRLGRWFVIAQVKQLLIKIAQDQGETVDALLARAVKQHSATTQQEIRYSIEQVNDQYYAWGPEGFAGQHSDAEELIKQLNLNPHQVKFTQDKLTKHDTD